MSRTSRIGLLGENGVVDFINQWYPAERYEVEGYPFSRVRSKGSKDEGDVLGPLTAIEVKNYSDPPLGALLRNAEWKAINANRPYWALCYKAKGVGIGRAGKWHVAMTVEELLDGFKVRPGGLTNDDIYQILEERFAKKDYWERSDWQFTEAAAYREYPDNQWTPEVLFFPYTQDMTNRREQIWEERNASETLDPLDKRICTLLINPRTEFIEEDGSKRLETLHPSKWFVYTKLAVLCRMLETVGVLPQDPSEFES